MARTSRAMTTLNVMPAMTATNNLTSCPASGGAATTLWQQDGDGPNKPGHDDLECHCRDDSLKQFHAMPRFRRGIHDFVAARRGWPEQVRP